MDLKGAICSTDLSLTTFWCGLILGNIVENAFRQRGLVFLLVALVAIFVTACRSQETRFHITNFDPVRGQESFFEVFDECYYTIDPAGNLDVVARRRSRPDDRDLGEILQIVHLRTLYRHVSGAMASDKTMINAVINYAILGPDGGSCYEGAGFVYFQENIRRGELRGELELSTVRPNRKMGRPTIIFDHAELTGYFSAKKNRRKVVQLFNQLQRVFGRMPRFEPPQNADVM